VGDRAIPHGAPPRPWRLSARLLVVDEAGRVLLLRAVDPVTPEPAEWWEVPGGGVESAEDSIGAALREVAEETGLSVPRSAVGEGSWSLEVTFQWLGRRHWARNIVHVARVANVAAPDAYAPPRHTSDEAMSFLERAWLPIDDLRGVRTFPDGVVTAAPRLLAGERFSTGFAVWS